MITFLFWNLNKKPLQSLIAKLTEEYDVDLLILAECSISPDVLLQRINRSGRTWERKLTACSEEEFIEILSQIFHSKKTQDVIGRMIAQNKDYEPDKESLFTT